MPLPRDVGFAKDDFQKSKIYNRTDSLVNYILNILLMKPGNLPSQPFIGVDIPKYVHEDLSDFDGEKLRSLIVKNCEDLLPYLTNDDVFAGVVTGADGVAYLIIRIPIQRDEEEQVSVYYAFFRDKELNELKFTFLVDRD